MAKDRRRRVARVSKPAAADLAAVAPERRFGAPRRRKVGDTAGLETCATKRVWEVIPKPPTSNPQY